MANTTLYTNPQIPRPGSAIDVLAFVLSRPEALLPGADEEELEAAAELLDEVKAEAIHRWVEIQSEAAQN